MDTNPRILIVDDEEHWRFALRRVLKALEVQVTECVDGSQVLAACDADPPDLILMDMRMPVQGGAETCRQLQGSGRHADIPVIILSSLTDVENKVDAFHAGARDYVTKPYETEEVRARVRTQLELRRRGQLIERQRAELEASLAEAKALNRQLIQTNERLLILEGLKGGFFSLMYGSLGAPLREVQSLVSDIRSGSVPGSREAQAADRIQVMSATLERHLRNLVLAGELEAGEMAPHTDSVDIGACAQAALRAFGPQIALGGVELETGGLPAPGALVLTTDGAKVAMILENLLDHALRVTARGGKIRLEVAEGADGIKVFVEDGHEGLEPEELAFLFEKIRPRGEGDMTLPVTRSLVELLGGWIRVDLVPGGSRFTVHLPPVGGLESLAERQVEGGGLTAM